MDAVDSPILSVPGIGMNIGAIILAEIGDFSRFENLDKILAFAGCSPSTYQSGQLYSSHAKMKKRGSRYLRWALINAASYVCNWEPTFSAYPAKKRAEGKHYYVALSHAAKKLVRLFYHLETTGDTYQPQNCHPQPELKFQSAEHAEQSAQPILYKPKNLNATIFRRRLLHLFAVSSIAFAVLFIAFKFCLSRATVFNS